MLIPLTSGGAHILQNYDFLQLINITETDRQR